MPADAAAPPGWVRREIEGFAALTGPFWQLSEASGWAYGVLATRDHANVHGIVHGGMLVTLLDNALGLTVFEAAGRVPCVTMQLNTQFLAAARPGEFLEARGEVLRRARSAREGEAR
jgi:acyl-coenzyme A thioesterase PaaI-like protein